jgi:predicted phosphodiesterase
MMDPRDTDSAVFHCEIVNLSVAALPIPVTQKPVMWILLISDTHIGARRGVEDSFITALNRLIQSEKAMHVVHFGDLIDYEVNSPEMQLADVLGQRAALPVPIWLISSNQDRE